MVVLFALTAYIILSSNYGIQPQCGLVKSINAFFDDNSSGFLKYFGMKKNDFLDDFHQDLSEFKPSKKYIASIKEMNFGQEARILQNDLRQFTEKYKNKHIPSCSGKKEFYPFQTLYLDPSHKLNLKIKDELEELISFGQDINMAAFNMQEIKKDSKKMAEFSQSIKQFHSLMITTKFTILNSFKELTQRYNKIVVRLREALVLMLASVGIYIFGYFMQKRFVRI